MNKKDPSNQMETVDRQAFYQAGIEAREAEIQDTNFRYNFLSYARLGVFVLGVVAAYFLFEVNPWAGIGGAIGGLLLFIYLIQLHAQIAQKRDHLKRLVQVQLREKEALDGKFLTFYDGKEWIDSDHPFSYDMDLFGRSSIFQYLNRAGTLIGRRTLANWLQKPLQQVEQIRARQQAVQELADQPAWTLQYQALGLAELEAKDESERILRWVKEPPFFNQQGYLKVLVWLLPALFFLLFGGYLLSEVPGWKTALRWMGTASLVVIVMQFAVVGLHLTRTSKAHSQVSKSANLLRKYASLLKEIEGQEWQSPHLQGLKVRLQQTDQSASQAIEELGELVYQLDQRINIVMGIVLNGTMLWDIRYMLKLEAWQQANRAHLGDWFAVISEWDALISLARFAFHHPNYPYPELAEGPFQFHASQLGHPLIAAKKRIDNDVSFHKPGEFLVITGANMAGKSTFLRTVGTNLVLGMMGAPVCAKTMKLAPIEMISSVRATDSLADDESYFFAELKRLKRIIDKLKAEGTTFVIVDEMLRGTNSKDKQTGSRQFIEQLIDLKAVGMIATHDLALGTLAEEYPEYAFNKRFEVDLSNDRLAFDYQLKDGISQNLNATFLMKQMGIMP
ncbi:MAG: hypothetical protein AAF399_23425 [Bacteroidota bacterium]